MTDVIGILLCVGREFFFMQRHQSTLVTTTQIKKTIASTTATGVTQPLESLAESEAMRAEIGLLKTASADQDETMMAMKNTMDKMQEQLDKLTAAISAKDGDEGMTAS